MPLRTDLAIRIAGLAALAFAAALLAGCVEDSGPLTSRSEQPLSPQVLALMQDKGTTPEAPMLIRAYKKEAEFEIWKMRGDGRYALLKTYPMCRWSGQLGPKVREGDRQVPEGFYAITPGQMNPNSNYYLSFNVGYPNAYDRAHGHDGASIMVHGACSSAGCFSMTDQQIAEIYVIARESFSGGQRAIQMQSLPFHMTAENLAKYRLDPNIEFWKELKTGSDNFEVTGQEVTVGVCDGRYVFNAAPGNGRSFDPTGPCPTLKHDELVQDEVLAKQKRDDAKIAELFAQGVAPVRTVYVDGGQNPSFSALSLTSEVSRPDALAQGPADVAVDDDHKRPTPAQLEAAEAKDLAEADAAEKRAAELRAEQRPVDKPEPAPTLADAQPQSAPVDTPQNTSDGSLLTRLFKLGAQQGSPAPTQAVAQQSAQPQAAAPDEAETGNAQFYQQTHMTPEKPAVDQTETASTEDSEDAAADVPVPPVRKHAQAQKMAKREVKTARAHPEPEATQPPAQQAQAPQSTTEQAQARAPAPQPAPQTEQAQAPLPPGNVFGGLTPVLPPGFSLGTPDH
jgi:murein L,D-transpeptidase YafK